MQRDQAGARLDIGRDQRRDKADLFFDQPERRLGGGDPCFGLAHLMAALVDLQLQDANLLLKRSFPRQIQRSFRREPCRGKVADGPCQDKILLRNLSRQPRNPSAAAPAPPRPAWRQA